MREIILIPKLTFTALRKNATVYLPYIFTVSFSVCVFFIFSCIIGNPMMDHVPYAGYVKMLLDIGRILLGLILIPFLFYTNSFLIKRRKKELGLYTVLGLEKKHIGLMMFLETCCIYVISSGVGLLVAIVFSRLVFWILLRMSNMPKDTGFTMTAGNFIITLSFFGFVSILNLLYNLCQVTMTNPTELLRSGRKGEREPKRLWPYTIAGLGFLAAGYYLAITTKMSMWIFPAFFLAVFFVVLGTYFLFTSGSIVFLRGLRNRKGFYYKKSNFVTISGMLYRMKRSAASLSNICIFSTMVIITLICTIALTIGEKDAIRFQNKFDVHDTFYYGHQEDIDDFKSKAERYAQENGVVITNWIENSYCYFEAEAEENQFPAYHEETAKRSSTVVRIMSLDEYNRIEGKQETLEEDEVLIFAEAEDYGYQDIILNDRAYKVKEELKEFRLEYKEPHSYAMRDYYIIMKDWNSIQNSFGGRAFTGVRFDMNGAQEAEKAFITKLHSEIVNYEGYESQRDICDWTGQVKAMDGGLLFIGVFFGLVFTICLLLIMYYKQISEGLEDQDSFHIMKQVGMSDDDVRQTIDKQIRLVFFLPLLAAVCHTFAGLPLTICLLYALSLFHTTQIVVITLATIAGFTMIYCISYKFTTRTYYRLVR